MYKESSVNIVEIWVKFRSSRMYVVTFLIFNVLWIGSFYMGFNHFENKDLTIVNLAICIVAELSAVSVLSYSLKTRDDLKVINQKLDLLLKIDKRPTNVVPLKSAIH